MRTRLAPAALALTLVLNPTAHASGMSFSASVDHDKLRLTCSDIEMRFSKDVRHSGDFMTVRRDRTIALPSTGSTPMRVRAPGRGGVRVQPSADGSASALVCMVAGANSQAAANAILDRVRVVNENGELTVAGPDDEDWAAYVVLSVPHDALLDLSAENGELALRGVSGHFSLRTTNGPIAVLDVAGEVVGEAVNGPISFRGHAGDIRLTAENGPVDVKLDAATWTGKGLDARTTNGPVQLSTPENLRAGVLVEGSANSLFSWKNISRSHSQGWTRDHAIRLGEGPVLVRLSTVNGPVQIKGGKGSSSIEGI